MKREVPEVGAQYDAIDSSHDVRNATLQTITEILLSRFKTAAWHEPADRETDGRLFKTANLSLSRSTFAHTGSSAMQVGLFPTVRNTRFLADRLQRLKVDYPKLQIPNDGALISGASARLEGDEKGEQGLDIEAQEISTRSIAAFKVVTDETLEDYGSGFQSMIVKSLLRAVMMRIDAQIIAGDGTAPNVLGIRNWSGIGSQTKSSDSVLVATSKAAQAVYAAGYTPDLILMHPADWQAWVTTAAIVDPFLGLDVFVSEASPSGLPTVLDTSAVYFLERSPITLAMTKTNEDSFLNNTTTLRAEQRCAIGITDVGAVCKVV